MENLISLWEESGLYLMILWAAFHDFCGHSAAVFGNS